jgi:hypothetical protein
MVNHFQLILFGRLCCRGTQLTGSEPNKPIQPIATLRLIFALGYMINDAVVIQESED